MNDLQLDCSEDELVELTLGVASGMRSKAETSVFIAAHTEPIDD